MMVLRRLFPLLALALILDGCAKSATNSSTSTTTTSTDASPAPAAPAAQAKAAGAGDSVHGHAIFTANCAQCHGENGTEGGVGPSLKNEKSRKDFAKAVEWIKNPQAPMPKLYPGTLSEQDVHDVAAFVQTL